MEHSYQAHIPENKPVREPTDRHIAATRVHAAREINGSVGNIKRLPNELPSKAILASCKVHHFLDITWGGD